MSQDLLIQIWAAIGVTMFFGGIIASGYYDDPALILIWGMAGAFLPLVIVLALLIAPPLALGMWLRKLAGDPE